MKEGVSTNLSEGRKCLSVVEVFWGHRVLEGKGRGLRGGGQAKI